MRVYWEEHNLQNNAIKNWLSKPPVTLPGYVDHVMIKIGVAKDQYTYYKAINSPYHYCEFTLHIGYLTWSCGPCCGVDRCSFLSEDPRLAQTRWKDHHDDMQ